ncbi:uncharacterized protein LOC124451511 [Xenia sp. Carnegie-2017]|uniref:uncharacterized protein LOC124451511 n=1 Tax=Xenia sp. Carnegie-2017 TaxID=2897299 RepID=UPI001F040C85|nr:uncharacterized protein LOC124451511 [Xenia sp. Carnegie-2017]
MQFLELLAACREFLPLNLLFSYLGFNGEIDFEVRRKIIELLSQIFPVYDDCLTVYHKSLIDWLKSDGYEQHEFTVSPKNGHKFLWHACEKVFEQIKCMNISEDQMNTATIKYALKNGVHHMIECGENVDFSWAGDVKVVGARLMVVEDNDMHTIRSKLPLGGSKPAAPTQSRVSETPPMVTPSQSTSSRVPSEPTNNDPKQPLALPIRTPRTRPVLSRTPPDPSRTTLVPPRTPPDPTKTPPDPTKTPLVLPRTPSDPSRTPTGPPRTPSDTSRTPKVPPRTTPDPSRTPTVSPRTQPVSPMPPKRENDSKLDETLKGLTLKRDQYKLAARNCNRSGDKENAKKYLIISKDFDVVIQAVKDGKDVDLTQCPPPPFGLPGFNLKSQFLDEHYNIKKDVHEKFKSISWICGNYGTVRKNKVISYPHLYITVDGVEERSDEDLKKEIDTIFEWEASKFIEIRRKLYKKPKIRYLSNFRAVQNHNAQNTMQIPNDVVLENQSTRGSHGTMTMFCGKNNKYYALTCAHVACGASDMVNSALAFNQKKDFWAFRDAGKHFNEGTAYFYKLPKTEEEVELPSKGVVGHFDEEVDIVRIFIGNKSHFHNLGGHDMERFVLNSIRENEKLYERIDDGDESVKVRTDYHNIGFISERCCSHLTKSSNEIEREIIFQDAVKVKSSCQFLKNGDSGVLVYFLKEQENWQPFSYGVCEIDDDDDVDDGNDDDDVDEVNDDDDVDGGDDGYDDGGDDNGGNIDDGDDGGGSDGRNIDDDDGGDDGDMEVVGVGDSDDDNVIFKGPPMKTFICLKLDKALTAVKLDDCEYFRSEIETAIQFNRNKTKR